MKSNMGLWIFLGLVGGVVSGIFAVASAAANTKTWGYGMSMPDYIRIYPVESLVLLVGCSVGGVLLGVVIGISSRPKPATPATLAAASSEATDKALNQLRKLKELLDAGVLTNEEFQEQKERVMSNSVRQVEEPVATAKAADGASRSSLDKQLGI